MELNDFNHKTMIWEWKHGHLTRPARNEHEYNEISQWGFKMAQ